MAYTSASAPAPRGSFWYDVNDDGIQASDNPTRPRLAQLGAQLANGTDVMLLMNTYALFAFPPLFVQWEKNRLCVLDRHYAGAA